MNKTMVAADEQTIYKRKTAEKKTRKQRVQTSKRRVIDK